MSQVANMYQTQQAVSQSIENTEIITHADSNDLGISRMQLAWEDLRDSIRYWRIWLLLAYQDIKLRYRRSVLGPFWITLSMAITVYTMGYLYSHLFHVNPHEYFPYLVAGMLAWSLISTTLIDVVDTFTLSENLLKQIKLPYILYIHRIATRNYFLS